MTTQDLVAYYPSLLILQYNGKARARGTVKTTAVPFIMPQVTEEVVTFSGVPTSGSYALVYGGNTTGLIAWNATAADVQTALRLLAGLSDVVVTGDTAVGFTVKFVNVTAPADLLEVTTNTLLSGSDPVFITVAETDETLPLAVMNGFNLLAPNVAVGVQLDVIGKYVGVSRSGQGVVSQVTLNDADFATLIKLAIIHNNSGSSLYEIQNILHEFFPNDLLVVDTKQMRLNYLLSTDIGSIDLIQLFISEGLLPRPMGVSIGLIVYAPTIDKFFGFRTYAAPSVNNTPFNSYTDYHTDWPWLSYTNVI